MKSCKSVELYAKEGGVGQGHPCKSGKSVKHSSKMDSGIIWQIMKSGKSVKLYAKVGGGRSTTPLQKWQKCETFVENGLWRGWAGGREA